MISDSLDIQEVTFLNAFVDYWIKAATLIFVTPTQQFLMQSERNQPSVNLQSRHKTITQLLSYSAEFIFRLTTDFLDN